MQRIDFKAGDQLGIVGELVLPVGTTWLGRSEVRDGDGEIIATSDDIEVTFGEPDDDGLRSVYLGAAATVTDEWPRPTYPTGQVLLYIDFEAYDEDNADRVMSCETIAIAVQFDPTRV